MKATEALTITNATTQYMRHVDNSASVLKRIWKDANKGREESHVRLHVVTYKTKEVLEGLGYKLFFPSGVDYVIVSWKHAQ